MLAAEGLKEHLYNSADHQLAQWMSDSTAWATHAWLDAALANSAVSIMDEVALALQTLLQAAQDHTVCLAAMDRFGTTVIQNTESILAADRAALATQSWEA